MQDECRTNAGERADDFVSEVARVYEQVRVHGVANLNLSLIQKELL